MADFKVDTSQLKSTGEDVHAHISQMRAQMDGLKRGVEELDRMWDGPASESFHSAFMGDISLLSAMIADLERLYAFETTARTKYDNCEAQVSGIVSQI